MNRAYRPERPSIWRDVAALLPHAREGAPMLAVFALVFVFSLLLEALQ